MKTTGYNSLKSWFALIACSMIAFFMLTPMRLAGLFFVILLDGYNTDRKKASVPIVIFGVIRTLTGSFTAVLGETFGFRAVTLVGCILGAVGVGSCFFAEDITAATICLGLIYGLGFAFASTLMPTIIKLHFTEHVNLVNGIWLTGSCAGAIIMSPVITFLQDTYGTRGMFLIVGGIFLNCIPAAIILKHPHNDRRNCKNEEENSADNSQQINTYHQNLAFILDEGNQSKEEGTVIQTPIESLLKKQTDEPSSIVENIVNDTKGTDGILEKNNKNCNCVRLGTERTDSTPYCLHRMASKQTIFSTSSDIKLMRYTERKSSIPKSAFENGYGIKSGNNTTNEVIQPDSIKVAKKSKSKISCKSFRLFTDPTFHFIMIVQSIHAFVTTLNWTIIVDYGRDKGISTENSVYFVMCLPIAEIFGNMCFNWITDNHFMTRTNFSLACFLILVLDAGYIMWAYSFEIMMVGVFIFGLVSGAVATTFPGIIIEHIEEEQQNMALASRFSIYAFLCMLKTPIIGYFRGTLGSYDWVYCIIMACSFTCCILIKLTPVLAAYRMRRKQSEENT